MKNRVWILGAPDPEMKEIENLLRETGETVAYATVAGRRVTPGEAYNADGPIVAQGCTVYWVECAVPSQPRECVTVVDHHRPGDPGYGRPPKEFFQASSLGQVLTVLGRSATQDQLFVAAADHCLAAAYRGECPGVEPDALMRWRAASRAAFQGRSVEAILSDIEQARVALRAAPKITLAEHICARDMRGRHVPELPEASAREGLCFVADGLPSLDGRVKVVCQSGTPEQIRAFMEVWAPANGLMDVYGDPARGFAGGYTRG